VLKDDLFAVNLPKQPLLTDRIILELGSLSLSEPCRYHARCLRRVERIPLVNFTTMKKVSWMNATYLL
jgi:hypothetical protein